MSLTLKCVLPALLLMAAVCSAQEMPQQPVNSDTGVPSAAPTSNGNSTSNTATNPEPVYEVGGSVKPPMPIQMVDPKLSNQDRHIKFSGQVVVALVVDKAGIPRNVHVVRGVGMGLDEKAVEAVQQYRFKPAMQKGKPVAVHLNVEVDFKIFK